MSHKSKKVLPVLISVKPRNPLVVAVMQRRAGSHRPPNKTLRAQSKRAFKNELSNLLKGESHSTVALMRRVNTIHPQYPNLNVRYRNEYEYSFTRGLVTQSHFALY